MPISAQDSHDETSGQWDVHEIRRRAAEREPVETRADRAAGTIQSPRRDGLLDALVRRLVAEALDTLVSGQGERGNGRSAEPGDCSQDVDRVVRLLLAHLTTLEEELRAIAARLAAVRAGRGAA